MVSHKEECAQQIMSTQKKILKIDNTEIPPIQFGEIIVKYEHYNPVCIEHRKKIKDNEKVIWEITKKPIVN